MAQAMKRPEVFGKPGPFLDSVDLLLDVHTPPTIAPRENVVAIRSRVRLQQFPCRSVKRYLLGRPALGVDDIDEAPVEVHM